MKFLVFNCGSSSLKFELLTLDVASGARRTLASGIFDRIGPACTHTFIAGNDTARGAGAMKDHAEAAIAAIDWIDSSPDLAAPPPDAILHRVVHGGETIEAPAIVNADVLAALERASEFAPIHNPPAIAAIRAVSARLPAIPETVVADTAFHRSIPKHAETYAIPRALAIRHGIHRFGFHGIGHAWMTARYAELTGRAPERANLITLQLGAGCSAAAIRAGKSVDTSMGLTPLEGLMMATRAGDLDPAIMTRLSEREGKTPAEVEHLLNFESGLLGVSAVSGDMRELERAEAAGNPDAALAIEMFCYRVRKYVGAYMTALGRTDAIVFGGGIGEHSPTMRERILAGLDSLGIALDGGRNRAAIGSEARISADASPIAVWVIPLDEELQMARDAAHLFAACR